MQKKNKKYLNKKHFFKLNCTFLDLSKFLHVLSALRFNKSCSVLKPN